MVLESFVETLVVFEAIILALIAGMFARNSMRQKEINKKVEARAAVRQEESLLSIRLMSANVKLAMVMAVAIKNEQANGAIDLALAEAQKADDAYMEFLKSVASKEWSKS